MTDKKTGFEKATDSAIPEILDDEGEGRSIIPRAVFTKDQKLDLSKLQINSLRVAQGMTAEVKDKTAESGQLVLSNFPAFNEVTLVPFGAPDIRIYKPDPRAPAVCNAPLGDFGFGTPGGVCELCPLSHWGDVNPATGKSVPPPCKEGVLVRAYSITHRCLVDMQFMGAERNKGGFIQQQAMSYGWAGFAIKVTSVEKNNNRGDWYVPKIEMLGEVPEDQQPVVSKWFEVFLASQVDSKAEALRQLNAGAQ